LPSHKKTAAAKRFPDKALTYGMLKHIARERGYGDGWASHKFRAIYHVWPNYYHVNCERRGRGSSPIGRCCSMSKAPNEAQGPRCQSPSALLRPSGEKTLDAVQHDLVVIGLHEQRPRLTQLSRILDCAPWRSRKQYLQFRSD
jgi:hypothetical protein